MDPALLTHIRLAGARVLGPRSSALVNTDPCVRLHVGPGRTPVAGGSLGVVTDDPACLERLRAQFAVRGLGASAIVDVGQAIDLQVMDVVAWLVNDPRTEVIVVALAGPAPQDLWDELASVHRTCKPVVLLTGDVAVARKVPSGTVPAPILATSVGDLADLTMVLIAEGQPLGRRVVVVTNRPSTPQAEEDRRQALSGLLGADLTQHSEMRIRFLSPGSTSCGAVVALPTATTADAVRDVVETLVEDPGVDALVIDDEHSAANHRALWQLVEGLPREGPTGRPTPVVVAVDTDGPGAHGSVPVFGSVVQALDGLSRTSHR